MQIVTPFARAIEALEPGAGGRAISKLLDGRATRHAALNWKAGRRAAPKWALDLLAVKLRAKAAKPVTIAAELERIPPRLGQRAGAKNLAEYLARRF